MQIEDFPSVIAAMQQKLLNEVTAARVLRRAVAPRSPRARARDAPLPTLSPAEVCDHRG